MLDNSGALHQTLIGAGCEADAGNCSLVILLLMCALRYDADSDGRLTSEEIAKAFQSGSVNISAEQVCAHGQGLGRASKGSFTSAVGVEDPQ
jgi:hypothetical protein